MRPITIRRIKPKTDLSIAASEVEAQIEERNAGAVSKTLKGAAFGAWYAKLTGPTIMWIASGTSEIRHLEEAGLMVAGYTQKGQYYAQRIVDNTDLLPEQQIAVLKRMDQFVAEHGLFTVASLEQVENYLTQVQRRIGASSLIVCDPKVSGEYATFKATTDSRTTTIDGVSWSLDRHGNLVPRLMMVPVIIKGTKISNVSGHNAKFMLNHGIGIGATVRICYEPGSIPIVDEVIGRADPEMPAEPYEWAGIHVRPVKKQLVE
jgi:hypothetical protein